MDAGMGGMQYVFLFFFLLFSIIKLLNYLLSLSILDLERTVLDVPSMPFEHCMAGK